MINRIAVPFLAMSLLATSALAADPSPKPPVASPAKVVASPKPTTTPSKAAAVKKPHKVAHAHVTRRSASSAPTSAAKLPVSANDKTAKSTVTK